MSALAAVSATASAQYVLDPKAYAALLAKVYSAGLTTYEKRRDTR